MRGPRLLVATALAAGAILPTAAASRQAATPPAAEAPAVDPAAITALETMSAYLRSLNGFELTADITLDEVTEDGRRLQIGSTAIYRVRKPDAFTIDLISDRKTRRLIYDGKTLTLYSPKVGFFARASAPPTIRETLDVLAEDYDFEVPLEDLFRWGEPGDAREAIDRGFYVGPARLNGVETDQFALSTGDLDWQIWIQRGDKPVPKRIVITSLYDPAQPQFAANLTWKPNPTFQAADFTFIPPADAKSITFARTAGAPQ